MTTNERTFATTSGTNYNLPNDGKEHDRLNLQHEALKLQAGENYLASLKSKDLRNILDICCGGGQWVVDMAYSFPKASVVGIDISLPKLDGRTIRPPNCEFIQGDVTNPLPFEGASFDFVQMRTVPSLPNRTHIMFEITRILRPRGIIQLIEPYESFSLTLTDGGPHKRSPKLIEVDQLLSRLPHSSHSYDPSAESKLKSWSIAPQLLNLVSDYTTDGEKAYTDVSTKEIVLPVGIWPSDPGQKMIAEMMATVQMELLDGFRTPFLNRGLLTEKEFDALRKEVSEEVYHEEDWKLCFPFVWVWGLRV